MEKYIGIIDLGSNTARLSIYYHKKDSSIYEIDKYKNGLRLSSYLDDRGLIEPSGFEKTIKVIEQFKKICISRGVEEIIGVATAAVRQAKNGKDLLVEIKAVTGISIQVLSGEEEARLGYLAIINTIDIKNAISIDIGGGSTEITLIEDRKLISSVSLPFGVVSLTKRFSAKANPDVIEEEELKDYLFEAMAKIPWLKSKGYPIVAIGGTARNLAKVHQRSVNYSLLPEHNIYMLKQGEARRIYDLMRSLPIKERQNIKGLSKDRADIMLAGIFVIILLMEIVKTEDLIISKKGLRDGLVYEKFN